MFDGKRTIWVGWIADTQNLVDGAQQQWGGTMCAPRELVPGPGGMLYVRPVKEVIDAFSKPVFDLKSAKSQYGAAQWSVSHGQMTSKSAPARVTFDAPSTGMLDMTLKPELVHAAMERLTSAYLCRLDQYEKLNLLALNNGNFRIGSGGLGFTDELPQRDFDPGTVTTRDQWGSATAQIFSEISPEMHWEFALQYEMRWLERFGLTYYGCCEPLHMKMDILKKIPNLRKVSMSPWINIDKAVETVEDRYVFSYKPNPAVLATDQWNPEQARHALRGALEKPCKNGCVVEVILKDVSTVRNEPKRVWEWADIAMGMVEEFAP